MLAAHSVGAVLYQSDVGESVSHARNERAAILLAAVVLVAGLVAQEFTFLNHDVAWVLYSSGLMLQGAVFGQDIIAANPPLIWWISTIPNAIATLLHLPLVETFRFFVIAVVAACLFASDRLLASQGVSPMRRMLFTITAAYLLTFGIDRDFGQREHLSVALVLPYLITTARRARGGTVSDLGGLFIGASAGIAIAFKPHFIFVPLFVEGVLLLRRKSLRLLIRPEAIGAISVVVLYALAVIVFARPWLFQTLPAISEVYWAFKEPAGSFLVPIAAQFALPLVGFAVVMALKPTTESAAFGLASVGFLIAMALQAKFYSYHVYPAYALLVLGFVMGVPTLREPWKWTAVVVAFILLVVDAYGSGVSLVYRTDAGTLGQEMEGVVDFVDDHTEKGGSFLAISTHPYPGFPTAIYTHRRWASKQNSRIYLPAVVRLTEAHAKPDDPRLQFAQRQTRDRLLEDLSTRPELVLVDVRPYRHAIGQSKFDVLSFYLKDPRIAAKWKDYRKLNSAPDGFLAYQRIGRS